MSAGGAPPPAQRYTRSQPWAQHGGSLGASGHPWQGKTALARPSGGPSAGVAILLLDMSVFVVAVAAGQLLGADTSGHEAGLGALSRRRARRLGSRPLAPVLLLPQERYGILDYEYHCQVQRQRSLTR